MKAAITGVGGFLGQHLGLRLLNEGWELIGYDINMPPHEISAHPYMSFIKRDLSSEGPDPKEIEDIDVFFHLAGATQGARGDELFFLNKNEQIAINSFKAIRGKAKRIIFASSQVIYGDINSLSIDEEYELKASDSAYACSKLNCENWLRFFQWKNDLISISLRLTGFVEGGGVVDYFISKALLNEPIEIYSLGTICRDYLAVSDGIQAFISAAQIPYQQPCYDAFNIGSGQKISALELARLVCEELGSSSQLIPVPKPAPRANFVYDINKAKKELGFSPKKINEAVISYLKTKQKILNKTTPASNRFISHEND